MMERLDGSNFQLDPEVERLIGGAVVQAVMPPDCDPSIGRLFAAFGNRLPTSPLLEPFTVFAKSRRDHLLVENIGTVRGIMTNNSLLARNPRMPREKIRSLTLPSTVEEWEDDHDALAEAFVSTTPTELGEHLVESFLLNLYTKDNQANSEARYTTVAETAAAYGLRWPEGARVLDVGGASRQGVNSLARHTRHGLLRTTILEADGSVDTKRTRAYNHMVRQQFRFLSGIAIDALNITTEDDLLWPISNLRHTSEIGNSSFMRRYLRNAHARPANVAFEQCDFSVDQETAEFLERHKGESDVTVMSMVVHQNDPDKGKHIVTTAYEATADHGILVLQDNFEITGTGLHDLHFKGNWFNGLREKSADSAPWGVAVFDKANEHLGWQIHFKSPRSRYDTLIPADGVMVREDHHPTTTREVLDEYAAAEK